MELLRLFLEFFRIGICAFGGGLATIPFLEELSNDTNWFSLEQLGNMLAISESTPGAIGVNMATYVGYLVGFDTYNNVFMGFIGGIIATLGFIAPSVIVILIVCQFLKRFKESKVVKWALYGLRAASFALICRAAYSVLKLSIIDPNEAYIHYQDTHDFWGSVNVFFDYKALILGAVLAFLVFKFKKHPIIYIAIAAIIGIIFRF